MTDNASAFLSKVDAVFGALGNGDHSQQWRPSLGQASPGALDEGNSEDEAEEQKRREIRPGIAMDLAEEDAPNHAGFKPSIPFCKAVDMEEEEDEYDVFATQGYDAVKPPSQTEVIDDQNHATNNGGQGEEPSTSMTSNGSGSQGSGAKSILRPTGSAGSPGRTLKKRVSWRDSAPAYVPPHHRQNFTSQYSQLEALPPLEALAEEKAQRREKEARKAALLKVPGYVQEPEKYTR